MRRAITILLIITLIGITGATGCSPRDEPLEVSRPTLGTAVIITAYGERSRADVGIERTFVAMDRVSAELDAYAAETPIARFNRDPFTATVLPRDAISVLEAVERLGVGDSFSATLFGVSALYKFESEQTVPSTARLEEALLAASMFVLDAGSASFVETDSARGALPGLDFGGAAKGLGLDLAADALSDDVDGAVISAGSTTVTIGTKPSGGPWRVGIEDPRDTERVVAVVEAVVPCSVSTSGDYQRYFETDGVRYHHILDPASGTPARGLRSLTVFGPRDALTGLDADILSTALFVMGTTAATSYAQAQGIGLYMVDDEGRALIVPAPEGCGVRLVVEAEPIR